VASIRARHEKKCKGFPGKETRFEFGEGCTCSPSYSAAIRDGRKKRVERLGKNRKQAERAANKLEVEVDEGSYRPTLNITFEAFGPKWLASLECKENTRVSYVPTIAYAVEAFGSKPARRVTATDVARFNQLLKTKCVRRIVREDGTRKVTMVPLADSTRAKHLRVLHACFESAVQHGYVARNPVADLPKAERPKTRRTESAYFENDELAILFNATPEGVYRNLFETAYRTGMRAGELAALTWNDVDLLGGVVHVRRNYTRGMLGTPKGHEIGDVDLMPRTVEMLGAWWGELGSPGADKLVFPGPTKNGYLTAHCVLNQLYRAMERAGVPREGSTGEKRTFHSFRHTFAKLTLEDGRPLAWLSSHLRHKDIATTDKHYGHFGRSEQKRHVELLEGAFSV